MHESKTRPLTLLLFPSVLCLLISVAVNAQQEPDLFGYRELVQLYEQETPPDSAFPLNISCGELHRPSQEIKVKIRK